MRDFADWEPGSPIVCIDCGRERKGDDPPGYWQRHYPTMRRRLAIFGSGNVILGYLEFVRP